MTYDLVNDTGTLEVPSGQKIVYKELEIVGRDSKDWNAPIQQNFVKVADKIDTKANATDVTTSLNAVSQEIETVSNSLGVLNDFDTSFNASK